MSKNQKKNNEVVTPLPPLASSLVSATPPIASSKSFTAAAPTAKSVMAASQYINGLLYIRNEDANFKNSFINIVNNKSDLRKFLLATNNYGKNIQENIDAVFPDGKFNQAVVRRALD